MGIKGMPVVLYNETTAGTDEFNNPIYTEVAETVNNVLVGEPTQDDIVNSTELYGKKATYVLGIPKGDIHDWTNKKIEFFGQTFKSFGIPIQGIEANIPLSWNKKVMVELYG